MSRANLDKPAKDPANSDTQNLKLPDFMASFPTLLPPELWFHGTACGDLITLINTINYILVKNAVTDSTICQRIF